MEIEELREGVLAITMTTTERNIITNCLAYLCYAETPHGFSTIAGAEEADVEQILAKLLSVAKHL
jgi:hypothetical protein